jgi:hypothetical protein
MVAGVPRKPEASDGTAERLLPSVRLKGNDQQKNNRTSNVARELLQQMFPEETEKDKHQQDGWGVRDRMSVQSERVLLWPVGLGVPMRWHWRELQGQALSCRSSPRSELVVLVQLCALNVGFSLRPSLPAAFHTTHPTISGYGVLCTCLEFKLLKFTVL